MVNGKFQIGPCFYTKNKLPLQHATDIEVQLCLNQLSYVAVLELMIQKQIPELKDYDFQELQLENMVITKSGKQFKQPMRTDKIICGEMRINPLKEHRPGILFSQANFQFENSSCFGEIWFAIINPNI